MLYFVHRKADADTLAHNNNVIVNIRIHFDPEKKAYLLIIIKIQPSRSRSCILNWALHKNLGYRSTDIVLAHTQADTSNVFHFWCELWLDAFLFNQHTHTRTSTIATRSKSSNFKNNCVFLARLVRSTLLVNTIFGALHFIFLLISPWIISFHFEFNSKLANEKNGI